MKMLVVMTAIVVMARAAGADGRPLLNGSEAPRATDLLRAQKLAEQAEKRRALPTRRHPGWKRGGTGWNDRPGGRAEPKESVVVNVRPSKPRAR